MTRRKLPPSPQTPPGGLVRYRSRILDSQRHDPYAPTGHYRSPTRCAACGAVYSRGRWRWGDAPENAATATCPACRRTADGLPAGVLRVEGDFARAHGKELLNLVENTAERERSEHPMNRVMSINETERQIEITTTDIHSPQRIGEALRSAHQGDLEVHYGKDDYSVRVVWRR